MKQLVRRWLGIDEKPKPKTEIDWRRIGELLNAKPKNPYVRRLDDVRGLWKAMPPPPDLAMDFGGEQPQAPFLGPNWDYLNAGGPFDLYFPGYPLLAQLSQISEYVQPAHSLANDATRKWIGFKSRGKGDKTQRIKEIEDECLKYKVRELMYTMSMYDSFFGMGHIYIAIKGQDKARSVPLKIDVGGIERGTLEGFRAIEPIWTTPITWNADDPVRADFYRPTEWQVIAHRTHASRLLTFISRPMPDILKPAYNFGGISLSQLIRPYVDRWLTTVTSVNRLIRTFSLIYLASDLADILQGGGPDVYAKFQERMQFFNEEKENQGIMLLDKEREQLGNLAVPLGSLDHLQAQAQEHMAAPTHEPLSVMTGITPSGLNASGEDEIEIWHNWVHSYQSKFYTDNMNSVLRVIQLNRWGAVDDDITFDYEPLKEVTGEAASRMRKEAADAGQAYITSGVIEPQEERQRLATDPDSGYTNLDMNKKIEPPALEGTDPEDDDDDEGDDDD